MDADDADVLLTECRRAVAEAGLTQEQVAHALRTDQGRVSNLLAGRRGATMTAQHLIELEDVCGLPPGEILRRVAARVADDHAYAASHGGDPGKIQEGTPNRPPGMAPEEQEDY